MMQGHEAFQRLMQITSEQFVSTCKDKGYRVLVANADRHGSIVWEAGRANGLNRFILLGLTEVELTSIPEGVIERTRQAIGDIEATFEAEVWVAADDNARFTRVLFDRWPVFLSEKILGTPAEGALSLVHRLNQAINRVEILTADDLTEEYLVSRGEGSHSAVASA
ncbi:MAG: hypothetical protein AB7V46_11600 [Thermomicrobiales bacterium]